MINIVELFDFNYKYVWMKRWRGGREKLSKQNTLNEMLQETYIALLNPFVATHQHYGVFRSVCDERADDCDSGSHSINDRWAGKP